MGEACFEGLAMGQARLAINVLLAKREGWLGKMRGKHAPKG